MKMYYKLAAVFVLLAIKQTASNAADTAISLPENSWLGDNGVWYCDDGFKKSEGDCVAIEIPENAFAYGSEWYCKTGFVRLQGKCLAKAEAERLTGKTSDIPLTGSIAASTKSFTSSAVNAQQQSNDSSASQSNPSPSYSGLCAENGSCYGDISEATGRPKTVRVRGYYRRDGTYVRGHYRSSPR